LGAGDIIRIDSFDTPELILEPRYNVLLDGAVNLPWVGSVSVQNLTLEEAARVLSQSYNRFIRSPLITVTLVAPRPLKIGVIGEVNRPGSYIISVISNESTLAGLTQRTGSEGGNQWPTVSRAIQTAGGITEIANVRGIEVRRPKRETGELEIVSVDLWKFLQEGDLSQDILLRDGDTVSIPTADLKNLDAAEVTKLAVSNFSPEAIRVNVVGEVITPGVVTIRPNATLSQAVLAAGGFRKGRADQDVELIRLNPNGQVTRRKIEVELSSHLDDNTNPPLRNNDIVVVRRNTFATVTDTLGTVLSPFSGLLGIFNVLGVPFPSR
jgi:polysaccharide export outer membrane protein